MRTHHSRRLLSVTFRTTLDGAFAYLRERNDADKMQTWQRDTSHRRKCHRRVGNQGIPRTAVTKLTTSDKWRSVEAELVLIARSLLGHCSWGWSNIFTECHIHRTSARELQLRDATSSSMVLGTKMHRTIPKRFAFRLFEPRLGGICRRGSSCQIAAFLSMKVSHGARCDGRRQQVEVRRRHYWALGRFLLHRHVLNPKMDQG